MASLAIQQFGDAASSVGAPAAAINFAIRALDWPCWEAPSMREAWDLLPGCAVEPNPYFESWHLLPALRALDPGETVQLLMFEADGQLAGMIPIARRNRLDGKRNPHLALWTHPDCRHGAPLVAAGREREFWTALLDWCDGWGRHGGFLHLAHLPLDGPLHRALDSVLAGRNRYARLSFREERPMLAGGPAPEDYFAAALTEAERDEMGAMLQGLAGQGDPAFDRCHSDKGLDEWIDRFIELDPAGQSGGHVSTAGKLFRAQLEGAALGGRLERLTLSLDGKPIAMQANFIAPPGAFVHRTAWDRAHAEFSPQFLLHCENLLILDRKDIAWTDSCTNCARPAIDRLWRERRTTGSISVAIGGKLRQALYRGLKS